MPGEWDEDKHPRAKDGKFGSDHGSRATESLKDRAFISEHGSRLSSAANWASSKFPREQRGTDEEHGARLQAMHAEAMRVHAEHDIAGSPHADRLRQVLDSHSHLDHAAIMEAVNEEHAAIENEEVALKAGHITEPSSKLTDKFEATREAAEKEHQQIKDEIHGSGQEAVSRVAELNALNDEENGIGGDNVDLEELGGEISELTGKDLELDELDGPEALDAPDGDADIGVDPDEDDPIGEAPKRDDFDDGDEGDAAFEEDLDAFEEAKKEHEERKQEYAASLKEHQEKKQAYETEIARRQAAYAQKAEEAQDALEALHEQQSEALGKLDKLAKEHDKAFDAADDHLAELEDEHGLVNERAFEDAERKGDTRDQDEPEELDDDEFTDPAVQAAYDRATEASNTRVGHLRGQLERRRLDISRTQENLAESVKTTASAIKRLAKITGRAAKLPAKRPSKTRKSGNRPGGSGGASLADMARYKLKLSKLDFISLVDRPAQETATIRLIKRAGTEQVQARAVARVVKIGEGDNPLVYCWAFTCTGEDGKPYHDLQDDAVDQDFIKAAEDFMRAGAAVDEMHDGQQTSRVAFAFPMDSDIAAGMFGDVIGKAVKTSGLMVAIRPSPTALVKLRAKTYTGVSIAGLGTRELAKGYKPGGKGKPKPKWRKKVGKLAVLTSAELGHQHTIDLDAPACRWSDSLSTSYQNAEGAESGHAHAWVYDATTGAITVAMDAGHTHTVEAVVPADVLAAALAEEAESPEEKEEEHHEPQGGEGGAPTVVVVSARAPGGVSTPAGAAPTVKGKEQGMPTEQENQIASLRKMLAAALAMTEPQRLHVAKLARTDVEAFLAMTAAERDAVVKAAELADPEVYKTAAGLVIRKSDGAVAKMLAEQADASAAQLKAQGEQLAIAKAATETAAIEKRASADLSHFAKSLPVHVAMVRAIDTIPDEAVRKEALESLRAANAAMAALGKAHGVNDESSPVAKSALEAWNTGLVEFAKAKSIKNPLDAIPAFLDTESGKTLKRAYDATRGYAQSHAPQN